MGNPVVWKPSPTQQFSAHFVMRLLEAAGLPPGVVNMVTGHGSAVSEVAVPSRAYVPRSVWEGGLRDGLADRVRSLTYGDVTDFSHFGGAVIDRRAFDRLSRVVRSAAEDSALEVLADGRADDRVGYPMHEAFSTEYFGPVLAVHVYDDADWSATLDLVDGVAPYALTGAVIADDPYAVAEASKRLRFTAGNFYVNDKPTGAVVGQQPFGGARQSGTNDKAGSALNLQRWTSPRTLKTTFVAPTGHAYPHMGWTRPSPTSAGYRPVLSLSSSIFWEASALVRSVVSTCSPAC